MKLFVWDSPYKVSYGGTCLYVIAKTVEDARMQAKQSHVSNFGDNPKNTEDLSSMIDRDPNRICKLPYAEMFFWQE
jgi:hypothetical protein